MTGREYERKLVSLLDDHGWAVMKSPSSGSGTARDQPDLLAGSMAVDMPPLAIEAKTTSKNAYTVESEEADQLVSFAVRFGAVPVVAMYWKGPPGGNKSYGGWYFREVSEIRWSSAKRKDGMHNLRPRREDRTEWAQIEDLQEARLLP